jgi:broad specificity polyphosphatase/5'/3'-nucleotidase SurE
VAESDFLAISEQMISITPLKIDHTNYAVMDALKKWEL